MSPPNLHISLALHHYLTSAGLPKTAKRLVKEARLKSELNSKPYLDLTPLFERLAAAAEAEIERKVQAARVKRKRDKAEACQKSDGDKYKESQVDRDRAVAEKGKSEMGESVKKRRLERVENADEYLAKAKVKDNSFFAKGGDEFAMKAAQELIQVRGKDFTKAKNKKKRATFHGHGHIPMTINSVDLREPSSEEE